MIYSAQNIHQSVVNIPVNIQLEPDLEVDYLFYTPVHYIIYLGNIRVNIQLDLNLEVDYLF